jgi:hypothetical protein
LFTSHSAVWGLVSFVLFWLWFLSCFRQSFRRRLVKINNRTRIVLIWMFKWYTISNFL